MADVSVVLCPALATMQALKAGIMEIADIFVVNKSDREEADRLMSAVEGNLALHAYGDREWRPPIVKTIATTGAGVPSVVEAMSRFRAHGGSQQAARRRARSEYRLRDRRPALHEASQRHVLRMASSADTDRNRRTRCDPYTAAETLPRRP